MHKQQGLTFVELMVIAAAFLALAAVAVPRFMFLNEAARLDSVRALADEIRRTSDASHKVWVSAGQPDFLTNAGNDYAMPNGYPDSSAMRTLLVGTAMFEFDGHRYSYLHNGSPLTDCYVSYAPPSYSLGVPRVQVNVDGC